MKMWQHQGCLTQPHVGECNDADTSNVTTTFACRSHHPPACFAVHLHLFLPPLSTTSTITHTYAQSEAVSAHHNLGRTSVTKSTHPTSFHVLALEFGVSNESQSNQYYLRIIRPLQHLQTLCFPSGPSKRLPTQANVKSEGVRSQRTWEFLNAGNCSVTYSDVRGKGIPECKNPNDENVTWQTRKKRERLRTVV